MHSQHHRLAESDYILLDPRVKKLLQQKKPIGVPTLTAYVNILLQQYLPSQPDKIHD
tara:strand:+ start:25955 stop:26125 length:171 start_codon:yes stop_codon:yes gene_type:complete